MLRALKSFGARSSARATKSPRRRHPEVWSRTQALISIANRVEARAAKNGSLEITDASEVIAARELIGAQEEFWKAIQTVHGGGLDWSEIKTELIQPVLESSIVSDLAWLTINQMITRAEQAPRR